MPNEIINSEKRYRKKTNNFVEAAKFICFLDM